MQVLPKNSYSFQKLTFYLKKKKKRIKLLLLGEGGCGKTTLVNFLRTGYVADKQGAVSRTFYIKIDGCSLGEHKLQLFDLAGQRKEDTHPLDHLQNVTLKQVDAILVVFALDNLQSFMNIKTWYNEVNKIYNTWLEPLPPMLLIGNKLDLPRKVARINGEMLVDKITEINQYHEVSLFTGENMEPLQNSMEEFFNDIHEGRFDSKAIKKYPKFYSSDKAEKII